MPIRGLKDNTIKTSIAALNAALADAVALRMAIKQAHWTVKGPHFIAIHELFDTVAGRIAENADILAAVHVVRDDRRETDNVEIGDGSSELLELALEKTAGQLPY